VGQVTAADRARQDQIRCKTSNNPEACLRNKQQSNTLPHVEPLNTESIYVIIDAIVRLVAANHTFLASRIQRACQQKQYAKVAYELSNTLPMELAAMKVEKKTFFEENLRLEGMWDNCVAFICDVHMLLAPWKYQ